MSDGVPVRFRFLPGLLDPPFTRARLCGSWSGWAPVDMERSEHPTGRPCWEARVEVPAAPGETLRWGVAVDAHGEEDLWAIPQEVDDPASTERTRAFELRPPRRGRVQEEELHLTAGSRWGALPWRGPDGERRVRFSLWAPHARRVEVVFVGPRGYVADDGDGVDPALPVQPMERGPDGTWSTDPAAAGAPRLEEVVGRGYMFRVTREDGSVAYRTDLYSRQQQGRGYKDPKGAHFRGRPEELDGGVSASLVVDPARVRVHPHDPARAGEEVGADAFWEDERGADRPVPRDVRDLVIYELHVGALGYGKASPGTLEDAEEFLEYLSELGVNAVELLPVSEFPDRVGWGYGTTHFLAPEGSLGGADGLKHLVRAAHRRGIAVILDVVFNHYASEAERAQWQLDSTTPEHNLYYWYEGRAADYEDPSGGYLVNGSSGYAPRTREAGVRQLFLTSAAVLLREFHVDGFRVDLTNALHRDNHRVADGAPVPDANLCGAKLLRELTRTLRLLDPEVILVAEDHSSWDAVTRPVEAEGLGFDARWDAGFYHHLIGDATPAGRYAGLLAGAGYGDDRPLEVGRFAEALRRTGDRRVVYHECHDEAGNSSFVDSGRAVSSRRTIEVAVNAAPLVGPTRAWAEARTRVAAALSLLSAGTPLFLMGEEVGAQQRFRYHDFLEHREDLWGLRKTSGRGLFRYYQDLVALRLASPALRRGRLEVVHADDATRTLGFLRRDHGEELLVLATLSNRPFPSGYGVRDLRLADGPWVEVLCSDAPRYGGAGLGNGDARLFGHGGFLHPVLPACSVVVLRRLPAEAARA